MNTLPSKELIDHLNLAFAPSFRHIIVIFARNLRLYHLLKLENRESCPDLSLLEVHEPYADLVLPKRSQTLSRPDLTRKWRTLFGYGPTQTWSYRPWYSRSCTRNSESLAVRSGRPELCIEESLILLGDKHSDRVGVIGQWLSSALAALACSLFSVTGAGEHVAHASACQRVSKPFTVLT